MMMKVEKQSSTFIKPFPPTPQTHCHYRLGFIDELAPFSNVDVVLFFSPISDGNRKFVGRLEKSLEKTLTRLYPLAGRYIDETRIVDCNDEGVEFIHAKVNIKLQEILGSEVDPKLIDEFFSFKTRANHKMTDPLLSIQVTKFECGGVAVSVSATHKIVDASTLCTFLNEWAAINREEENEIEFSGPGFNSSLLFPARCLHPMNLPTISDDMLSKYMRKKISFSESDISNIRANAAFASGKNSTRRWSKVQLVMAILSKAFIDVDRTYTSSRESMVLQPLNLRGKMASLIPKDSCGNLLANCPTKCGIPGTMIELADLLSDSVKKAINNFSKVHHDREEGQSIVWDSYLQMANIPESTHLIVITSWCQFPFYEANFGFGKPIWAAPGTVPLKNSVILMDDARGNGVDAHVFMEVKNFPVFEQSVNANALRASKPLDSLV